MVLAGFAARLIATIVLIFACFMTKSAYAADKFSSGDTAWILTATALVLLMTLPGLAFFLWRTCKGSKCIIGANALLRSCLPGISRLANLSL